MASTAKYDYSSLERQFIYGTMSIRQLCKDNDIPTWSTVSTYAKRNSWVEKREAYQQKQRESNDKVVAASRADKLAEALDSAIMVANQAVFAFFDSLRDRWVTDPETNKRVFIPAQQIEAGDFVKIMEKLMLLNGQFTSREAHVVGEIPMDMETLRDILGSARERGANARPVASSPLPRSSGPREVN